MQKEVHCVSKMCVCLLSVSSIIFSGEDAQVTEELNLLPFMLARCIRCPYYASIVPKVRYTDSP